MRKSTENFLSQFDPDEFPAEILSDYEPMELLSDNGFTKTYLLIRKNDGSKITAKCFDKTIYDKMSAEYNFLKNLSHKGLSKFIGISENDKNTFILNEYAEGTTLDRYVTANGDKLSDSEIIHIMEQLCDILTYLHEQKPPVIHRDIKPSNIIINGCEITLIDFGTSRCFDEKSSEDTLYLGTKGFAPPEQYGYAQTDCRADIYAAGIVLLYLCCNNTDLKNIRLLNNKKFAAIIKKCTEFSPKDRYSTASQLKAALLGKSTLYKNKYVISAVCILLTAALFITANKLWGSSVKSSEKETASEFPVTSSVPVRFESALIEQAVRQILHKSGSEQITEEELLNIDQLLIAGDRPSSTIQEYYTNLTLFYQDGSPIRCGDISSLSDIEKMPNLVILCLAFQQISDVSALKDMKKLEKLELNGNPVIDINPLSGLCSLQTISLQETRVSDTTPLNALEKLRYINIDGCRCESYDFLKYTGNIEFLDLSFASPEKVLPLLDGKTVRNFHFAYADLYSLSGFEKIIGLESLDVQKSRITDISAIAGMNSLTYINLAENPIDDLTVLLSLPSLKRVEFSRDMEDKVNTQLQGAKFDIAYR